MRIQKRITTKGTKDTKKKYASPESPPGDIRDPETMP